MVKVGGSDEHCEILLFMSLPVGVAPRECFGSSQMLLRRLEADLETRSSYTRQIVALAFSCFRQDCEACKVTTRGEREQVGLEEVTRLVKKAIPDI